MPRAVTTLEASAASVSEARSFLVRTLDEWGAADLEWSAALVLSELATNAVLHAGTRFTVALGLDDSGVLRLEVTDGSARVPRQRHYGLDATTGRGLGLVGSLSSDWGVQREGAGKTIWSLVAGGEPDLGAFLADEDLTDSTL